VPTRILFIGFDALDKDLLLQWAGSGILPTFRSLLHEATHGLIANPAGLYGGTLWPSFITGVSPARHRRFFQRQAPRGEYAEVDFRPSDMQGQPFWKTLSSAGRKVAILDVPLSPLTPHLNGIQLVDWSTHDPDVEPAASYPSTLANELVAQFGRQLSDRCEEVEPTSAGYKAFVHALKERTKQKLAISLHCLRQDNWDLLATVFGEAHCVGHQCWHLHDPLYPRHDPLLAAEVGDPMQEIYQVLDSALAQLLEAAGAETKVIVLVSHGMGPLYGESVLLDEILRRLENQRSLSPGFLFRHLKRYWYTLPPSLRESPFLRTAKAKLLPSLHQSMLIPERKTRRFFAITYNPDAGAVRINVVGRESHGLVHPGKEYREVCERLRNDLLALVNAETGTPVVDEVFLTHDLFTGPYLDELPDLLVEWSRTEPLKAIQSPRIGTLKMPKLKGRTGDHWNEGIFFGRGVGLRATRVERSVSIMDFAPTIGMLLGVPLEGLDGQPIPEVTGS
jgi:predicted AlkP superfamily phosphohydrolase/phosphomutase